MVFFKLKERVRKMKKMEKVFNSVVAVFATTFTYLFGGWDTAIIVLVVFMAMDYITGVIHAYVTKTLSSEIGLKGLAKKFLIILILIGAVCLDRLIGNGTWVFRTLVCYFYIANEGLSLLENASNLGLPVPDKLKEALAQLKEKTEEE